MNCKKNKFSVRCWVYRILTDSTLWQNNQNEFDKPTCQSLFLPLLFLTLDTEKCICKKIISTCIFIDLFWIGNIIWSNFIWVFYWSMLHIPVKNSCANKEIGDCSHDQTQRSHILLLHNNNNSTDENKISADTLLFLKASKSCQNTCPSARCLDSCRRKYWEVLRIVYRHHLPSLVSKLQNFFPRCSSQTFVSCDHYKVFQGQQVASWSVWLSPRKFF